MESTTPNLATNTVEWRELESQENPFLDVTGGLLHREQDGLTVYAFRPAPKHCNKNVVVHGGMLATFADHCLGQAAQQAVPGAKIATIHLGINYISAGLVGDFIEGHAEVVRQTRSLLYMRGELRAAGKVVATADGIWKILKR